MRYHLIFILAVILISLSFSTSVQGAFKDENQKHGVTINVPFWYFDYPYISLDLGYRSPSLIKPFDLFIKATFRSYGLAFWSFRGGYQDLKIESEVRYSLFSNKIMNFMIIGSGGFVWNFNTRTEKMSAQPIIAPGILYRFYFIDITIPVQMRFYNNGMIIRPVIEVGFWVSRVKIFYTLELTFSTSYDGLRNDFYGYNAFGIMVVI